MNQFLQRITLFLLINFFIVLSLIISSNYYAKINFNYSIPKSKNILIIGNSSTETCFYENFFPRATNVSTGGQLSFWTMIKLDNIIENNTHIDSVIYSYSVTHYYESVNNLSTMKYPIKNHSFLMKYQDWKILLKHDFINFMKNIPNTVMYNFVYGSKIFNKSWKDYGRFRLLKGTNVEEHKKKIEYELKENIELKSSDPFLSRINTICENNGVKLILVNTPVTKFYSKQLVKTGRKIHDVSDFIADSFKNITYYDYSNFQLSDKYFYDLNHLNEDGAKLFTEKFLKDLNSKGQ
jgi:hypothetical protein